MISKINILDLLMSTDSKSINEMIVLSKDHPKSFTYEVFIDNDNLLSLNIVSKIGKDHNKPKIYTTLTKKQALFLGKTLTMMAELIEEDDED